MFDYTMKIIHMNLVIFTLFYFLFFWFFLTSAKLFLTSKFSYLLFSNPTHQTKLGTAKRWTTTKF